jgi:hypothetical protein
VYVCNSAFSFSVALLSWLYPEVLLTMIPVPHAKLQCDKALAMRQTLALHLHNWNTYRKNVVIPSLLELLKNC